MIETAPRPGATVAARHPLVLFYGLALILSAGVLALLMLVDLADETADGRVVSMLEGGYALDGLASATKAHVEALTN